MNMLERFKLLFTAPSQLFGGIKAETDYKPTLFYYLVFILGSGILSLLISIIQGAAKNMQNTIVGFVTSLVYVFVFAYFLSLVSSWFGGSRSFVQGFKVAVYPGTIFALFGVLMSIIGFFIPSAFKEMSLQKMLLNLSLFAGIGAAFVLVALGLLVWSLLVFFKGMNICLDLSTGKSIGTAIIAVIFALIATSILDWVLTKAGLLKPISAGITSAAGV